ncbi:MAG: hypothetical protein EPO24_15030, partial [Bacteroidetes bacterium]
MMEKHIRTFLQYLEQEKQYSRHTIHSYEDDLLQFKDFLAAEGGIKSLTVQSVKQATIREFL